jgi:hypothetical protein
VSGGVNSETFCMIAWEYFMKFKMYNEFLSVE